MVVIGTPEGAAKIFRAKGKYPARGNIEKNIDWIYKKNNFSSSMMFA